MSRARAKANMRARTLRRQSVWEGPAAICGCCDEEIPTVRLASTLGTPKAASPVLSTEQLGALYRPIQKLLSVVNKQLLVKCPRCAHRSGVSDSKLPRLYYVEFEEGVPSGPMCQNCVKIEMGLRARVNVDYVLWSISLRKDSLAAIERAHVVADPKAEALRLANERGLPSLDIDDLI